MLKIIIVLCSTLLLGNYALAQQTQHPGCEGKDNNICDTLGLMINSRMMGCFRVMNVDYRSQDFFRITCELASYDRSLIEYDLRFHDNRSSYSVTPR